MLEGKTKKAFSPARVYSSPEDMVCCRFGGYGAKSLVFYVVTDTLTGKLIGIDPGPVFMKTVFGREVVENPAAWESLKSFSR
jgi:hypothetical protein